MSLQIIKQQEVLGKLHVVESDAALRLAFDGIVRRTAAKYAV